MADSIKANIEQIQQRIEQACSRAGRDRDEVQILPVTKTVSPDRIAQALQYGFNQIGENRVQEAESKLDALSDDLQWHFIGHLQSNKVNKVVRFASMVQSIDRMKIVKKMNRRLTKIDKTMDVLVQVNTSFEDSKYGVHPDNAVEFVQKAADYERLNIQGLMTIGLFSDEWSKVRKGFTRLRKLRDKIQSLCLPNVNMEHLSMGMTNDFELAIEEGATIVRVGRAIFGERETSDSFYWPGIEVNEEYKGSFANKE